GAGWAATGGRGTGLGGLASPRGGAAGHDTLAALIRGRVSTGVTLGILLVRSTFWAVSLGSGTWGGVLAPLLMMGGAIGGLAGTLLPQEGAGFWALIGMGAIMGGTMRSPFTGVVFAIELTHDVNVLFPLLVAVVLAHA